MKQLRLFTGLALPPDILSRFTVLLSDLRLLAEASWSPPENLHITTKFIGAWPGERLEEMKSALGKAPRPRAFRVSISGFGFFPGQRSPKTFYAGVHAGPALAELAHSLDEACGALGCTRETRPFSPHLTLARMQRGRGPARPETAEPQRSAAALARAPQKHDNIGRLLKFLNDMRTTDFGAFDASEFHLYLSKPGPAGSVYSQLASWRLPC